MAILAQDIKNLIPGCTVSDAIVELIITDAGTFVDGALGDCDVMSTGEVTAIKKWVAAHMLALGPCRQAKREQLGEAEVEYDAQKGTGLLATTFGQMALSLDRCGALNAVAKQAIKIRAVTSFE